MKQLRDRIAGEVEKAVVGMDDVVDYLVVALAVGGHVLLEGVPGVAKTLLANATARAIGFEFRRVQFTPDMLPSDLTGTMVLRGTELSFRPGPVFTSVLLADEINRTPPKTQAALLEAMQEGQVSVDGAGASAAGAVPRRRDPEPDRVRGDLSATRSPARPLPVQGRRRLPGRSRRTADPAAPGRRHQACRAGRCESSRRRGGDRCGPHARR